MSMKAWVWIIFILISGCEKEQPKWQRLELLEIARNAEPSFEVVMPESIAQRVVKCEDYSIPCLNGYKIKIKKMTIIVLEYPDVDIAYKAARRIDGYVTRNWVFDDVTGEPILERFVQKTFKAYRARTQE